ncbi:MAG: phage tail tape measure protein [Roseburia sp.]|nr:phage tail tape measure protein [Roseburia sp.]
MATYDDFADKLIDKLGDTKLGKNLGPLIDQLKKMAEAVREIDTAMTSLYKVTDETNARYTRFLTDTLQNAKNLGRTISDLIEQTANWAKLGFSLNQAEELAKASSIYANISGVDDDTAINNLAAAMKEFHIEAADSIKIVDKLSNLGKTYSTSSASFGEALGVSASALASAGNSMDESLALIAALSEITQDSEEAGNALKTLGERMKGADGESAIYSNELSQLSQQITSFTKTANTPRGISLFTDNTRKNYKSAYQLLLDISQVWNQLSRKNQSEILDTLVGPEYSDALAELLSNMSQAENALSTSLSSSGSALESQERALDSIEAKTVQFEAAFQSLSNTMVNSGLFKFFVDLGTTGVSALDSLINKIGALPALGAAIGGTLVYKKVGMA